MHQKDRMTTFSEVIRPVVRTASAWHVSRVCRAPVRVKAKKDILKPRIEFLAQMLYVTNMFI